MVPGIDTMASSPSHVLQIQPFLENFWTYPARSRCESEVGDLPRVALGDVWQLVPPRQRAPAPGHVQDDLGLRQVRLDLGVGPVPAVTPMVRLAHRAVALAVQLRGGMGNALDGKFREEPEAGPELTGRGQLEVCTRGLHGGNLMSSTHHEKP